MGARNPWHPPPTRILQIKVTAVKAKSLSINICVVCLMRETQHQLHASDIHIHVAPARLHPPTILDLNIIATLMPSCTPCQIDRRKMSIAAYQKRRVFILYTQFVQYIVYVGQIVPPPPPLLFHSCSHASILPVPRELSLMDPSKI